MDNAERADAAIVALNVFGAVTRQENYDYGDSEELLEIGGDLLCDLFHLCRQAGITPKRLYEQAKMHFDAERDGLG